MRKFQTFRSRHAEIQALQWFPYLTDFPGVTQETLSGDASTIEGAVVTHYVTTIHGQRVYLEPGDWVVHEPDGIHFYPVKDDIFQKRWQEVANSGWIVAHEAIAELERAVNPLLSLLAVPEGIQDHLNALILQIKDDFGLHRSPRATKLRMRIEIDTEEGLTHALETGDCKIHCSMSIHETAGLVSNIGSSVADKIIEHFENLADAKESMTIKV
jgi:hypothetical protein